jgi:hypothetical protein
MGKKRKKKQRGKAPKWTLENADRYALYEESVYDPEADLDFLLRIFREEGRPAPMVLREDFAGTCKLAGLWVQSDEARTAVCLDLDPEPLEYGRERHLDPIGEAAERIDQRLEDVLTAETPTADVVTAFNFSYWCFKDRPTLLRYFRRVHESLADHGAFVLDMQGGPDAQIACEEEREQDGFTYVWETEAMDAVTGDILCWIHFDFDDGTRLEKAFEYDWRVWHLTELKDVLREAGFEQVEVYWEGTDEDGEGDGDFQKTASAENEEAWIAYLVGWKKAPA